MNYSLSEYLGHEQHDRIVHCEECGRMICACFAICESCKDRLEAESEDEAQRWHDAREPEGLGKYF